MCTGNCWKITNFNKFQTDVDNKSRKEYRKWNILRYNKTYNKKKGILGFTYLKYQQQQTTWSNST